MALAVVLHHPASYRVCPHDAVRRVRLINHAQAMGFTLEEIREVISLRAVPRARYSDVHKRAGHKAKQIIDERIRSLNAMRQAMAALIAEPSSGEESMSESSIPEALDAEDA